MLSHRNLCLQGILLLVHDLWLLISSRSGRGRCSRCGSWRLFSCFGGLFGILFSGLRCDLFRLSSCLLRLSLRLRLCLLSLSLGLLSLLLLFSLLLGGLFLILRFSLLRLSGLFGLRLDSFCDLLGESCLVSRFGLLRTHLGLLLNSLLFPSFCLLFRVRLTCSL